MPEISSPEPVEIEGADGGPLRLDLYAPPAAHPDNPPSATLPRPPIVLDEVKYESGQPLRFKATFEVRPVVSVADYHKLPVSVTILYFPFGVCGSRASRTGMFCTEAGNEGKL